MKRSFISRMFAQQSILSIGYRRADKDDKVSVQVLNKFQFKIILFISIEISFSVSMEENLSKEPSHKFRLNFSLNSLAF